jgi:competence protein ComGC
MHVISIMILVFLACLTGCTSVVSRTGKVYTENVVSTASVDSVVTAYEQDAKRLGSIHAAATKACASGVVATKECARIDIMYRETRQAFIDAGNAYKKYLASSAKSNELSYLNAAAKYRYYLKQLTDMCRSVGIALEDMP